jgi:hypothetical protein
LIANRVGSIAWIRDNAITVGCNTNGTKYCPSSAVNRGSMAEFLFRMSGASATYRDYSPNFKDISNLPAERIRAINWMKDTGITLGSGSPQTYKPNDAVNRGSMAEFLLRYFNKVKR